MGTDYHWQIIAHETNDGRYGSNKPSSSPASVTCTTRMTANFLNGVAKRALPQAVQCW